ncbi:hypothetical protein VC83_06692 [Pseudogymnoascus destructans]|uniref:HTH APSES-type domain-containing protein n=2 Tax=Pseudogymnoascus destructans TaxID=655981 RepID=L8G8W1_PSED2|nr:uncharacterized protein VC83_06692 [Pseudogymnoascus destructans]ELR09304.1 hypothetical protein GMDG_03872 [Pseudogymnoascus destructans 20631-21]OAF56271.1 hypothetical protein VC83_06692 [Pseudogymnoascus destructans]
MSSTRHLPEKRNALLMVENAPKYESLIERRRLGQTDLQVKAKQLGTFDYAHLRAPLPKNVVSGIFKPAPASYFLMRRSNDGYISATGMFKATFPYSEVHEEEAERNYIKSLATTSPNETAGNVWISPMHALELADEYGIRIWIKALLDPTPIVVNPKGDTTPKKISPPPTFLLAPEDLAAPNGSSGRSGEALRRSRRSVSPSKIASPLKKTIATPRKLKQKAAAEESASASSKNLQQALKSATKPEGSPSSSSVAEKEDATASPEPKRKSKAAKGEVAKAAAAKADAEKEPKVTVQVDQEVTVEGGVETTHTHVQVEMPAGFAELPLPEDTEAMIAKAKEMVEAAVKADEAAKEAAEAEAGPSKPAAKTMKRKAEEEAEKENEGAAPAKRAKVESDLKKEKVRARALIGISATLAIGALIPYVMGAF